jgi:hypothetical protein
MLMYPHSAADVNLSSGSLLKLMLGEAHISTNTDFAFLDGGRLRICPGISASRHMEHCPVVFPVENEQGPIATTANKRNDEYTMIPVFSGSNLTSFMMLEASNPGEVTTLPPVCLRALEWPYQTYVGTKMLRMNPDIQQSGTNSSSGCRNSCFPRYVSSATVFDYAWLTSPQHAFWSSRLLPSSASRFRISVWPC